MAVSKYYEEDGITLYCGDCREILPELADGSVDLVLTDPPFSVPIKYHDSAGEFPKSWGDLEVMQPFFDQVFSAVRPKLSTIGQTYCCCDANSYPIFYKSSMRVWSKSHLLIWYKPTGRRGSGWKHSYELVLHLASNETTYTDTFRQDVIGIMPTRTLNREHPAEKPIDLWNFLQEAATEKHKVILDPFCGSGTTLVSAKQLGRKAIGIEIEEKYCEIAVKRLAQMELFK